ncbi:MAG: hypothetical protein M3O36_00665 [Myxococcota bacterium]|nr:hypothetical protein [Myxococcota bacterium]
MRSTQRPTPDGFPASMPPRYRELYQGEAVEEHAAIAARREGAPAHVEIWRSLPKGGAIVCVVADDCAGLLSHISAALLVHAMDVVAAQAYTRDTPRGPEAFDLFWLRRSPPPASPISDADVTRIVTTLRALVAGEVTVDAVVRQARARPPPPPGATTRVTFDETADADVAVLTVETFDRPGLLLAITEALSRARVQIIASEASTTRDRRVLDRFTIVELDGAPIRAQRRGVLQIEVLSAIDAVTHRSSKAAS